MTTAQQTDFLVYDRTLGMTVMEGKGFYYPVDTIAGSDDRLYVISRSKEETTRGIRVTMCDLDSGYYGNFGGYGFDGGHFVWPACGAVDSQGRFFISDERLHRITAYNADGSYLFHWGTAGSGDGELDSPSGLAFDSLDNIYVARREVHPGYRRRWSGGCQPALGTGHRHPGQRLRGRLWQRLYQEVFGPG